MSEDGRLIRNDPAIREIAQMVTNYCASCVELEARATAAEAENAKLRGRLQVIADGIPTVLACGETVNAPIAAHCAQRIARTALESRNVG